MDCHRERFPSTWASASQSNTQREAVTPPDDDDELPRWNTTKRIVSNSGRKRSSGAGVSPQGVGTPQSQPMGPPRTGPQVHPAHGEAQHSPRPGGPMLPARKAGLPGQQQHASATAPRSGPHLPEQRPLAPLQKPRPLSGTLRTAQVVVAGDKSWRAPGAGSAGKSRPLPGPQGMINVDARSAPHGTPSPPGPQSMASIDAKGAPRLSQGQPAKARPAGSASAPVLLPMASLGRPQSKSRLSPDAQNGQGGPTHGFHSREEEQSPPVTPLAVRVPWQRLERIPIACNGNRGYYVVDSGTCICCCVACTDRAKRADLSCSQISPTEFERHSGMSATKKWKTTLRVERPGGRSISLGAHLEVNGIWTGPSPTAPGEEQQEGQAPASSPAPHPEPRSSSEEPAQRVPSAALHASDAPGASTADGAQVKAEPGADRGVAVPISTEAAKARTQTSRGGPRTRGGHKRSHGPGRFKAPADAAGGAATQEEGQHTDGNGKPSNATRGRWLKGSKRNVKPQIRQGAQYQAVIPLLSELKPRPANEPSAKDGGRGGTLVPSAEAVLASVAGPEKAAADALPMDAKMDPNDSIGKHILLQRGQRQRKKPQWLDNTIDPHLTDKKWGLPAGLQDLEYEGSVPPDSDTGSGPAAFAPKRRKRSVPTQSQFQYHRDGDRLPVPEYYCYEDDDDYRPPVPKRMRSVAGDWPTTMPLDTPSPLQPGGSAAPQVLTHQVHQDGHILHVTIRHQGCVYAGALVLESRGVPEAVALPAPQALGHEALQGPRSLAAESLSAGAWAEEPGLAGSAAPSSSAPRAGEQNLLDVPIGQVTLPRQPPPDEGMQEAQSMRAKEKQPAGPKPKGEERRAAAAEEYHRLLQEGAPPGTKCVLCHQEQHADAAAHLIAQRQIARTPEGVSNCALGPLLLVRVSAISNAWVHMQCALWSGEVWVSEAGGLEKVDEAVRRGRMIKCKACNRKGATLGCHIRSCRHSFHMVCARATKCRLHEDGRLTCPSHLHLVPPEPGAHSREHTGSLSLSCGSAIPM